MVPNLKTEVKQRILTNKGLFLFNDDDEQESLILSDSEQLSFKENV